jgi:hypothetical protein
MPTHIGPQTHGGKHSSLTHVSMSFEPFQPLGPVNTGVPPSVGASAPQTQGMQPLTMVTATVGGLLLIAIVIPSSEISLLFTAGPTSLVVTLTVLACAALLFGSVTQERQGSVMGNNQALQVGAESLGVRIAGLLAAIVVKLPLPVFGGVLILAALLLVPFRSPKLGNIS